MEYCLKEDEKPIKPFQYYFKMNDKTLTELPLNSIPLYTQKKYMHKNTYQYFISQSY